MLVSFFTVMIWDHALLEGISSALRLRVGLTILRFICLGPDLSAFARSDGD